MLRTRLIGALARYLAQPVKRYSPATDTDPLSLSAVLHHGDVLLTEGNTRVAALVKRITRSTWSHVSMYVGPLEKGPDPLCIVEADIAAGVRPVRLSELKGRSEEHTSELQSHSDLVCRLLLEKKKRTGPDRSTHCSDR